MAYEIGDPNHIAVHNTLVTDVQAVADVWGVTVTLPDTANLGDLGHIGDHNLIVTALDAVHDAITAAGGVVGPITLPDTAASGATGHTDDHNLIADALAVVQAGQMPYNEATGGTVTDVPNYNGTGQTWRVHTFTSNGTFTVTKAPAPFRALWCGGGGGGGSGMGGAYNGGPGGNGQALANDTLALSVTAYPVTIGGGGAGGYYPDGSNGAGGGATQYASVTANGGGGGSTVFNPGGPSGNPGAGHTVIQSDIRGNGLESFSGTNGWGNGGGGSNYELTRGGAGAAGVLIIAYQIG